jgi:hypothetical protein
VELAVIVPKCQAATRQIRLRRSHGWLLLLLPVLYSWWVFGRLSTLEGTLEFDANAFWVFKAKILYLEQGDKLVHWMRDSSLAYAHWDYPMLVPDLYVLNYGAVGGVDEFVSKVWPFWMVLALSLGVLSLGKVWENPHPLPVLTIIVLCFLPASLQFIRKEGGTIPMVFYVSLSTLLIFKAITNTQEIYLAAGIFAIAGCAATKLEGVIYAMFWLCTLLPICWRRGWLRKPVLWKAVGLAGVCLVPYVWLRLDKPFLHPLSAWWRTAISAPVPVLTHFRQSWFLDVGGRFFNGQFFRWQTDNHNHLQWAGGWIGPNGFVNEQLAVLPWILVILLTLGWWKGRGRLALGTVTVVMVGVLTFLVFVIACVPGTQDDLAYMIDYGTSHAAGRYFYPFFAGWFLAASMIWFEQSSTTSRGVHGKSPAETNTAKRHEPG